jgi:selenide,water dikinase
METARAVFAEAGAEIIGGHSTEGAELTIGFTVTGLLDRAPVTLSGAQPGDALILTKPLGTGVILAAEMQAKAPGEDVLACWQMMRHSSSEASAILAPIAHAMTDVTGFGLAGHLHNICKASGVGAEIDLSAIPLLPGAEALSAQGIRSSLFAQNQAAARVMGAQGPRADLLHDPQTAGGLLAAVPASAAGNLPGIRIGTVTDAPGLTTI